MHFKLIILDTHATYENTGLRLKTIVIVNVVLYAHR